MRHPPEPGIEPMSPESAGRVLSTGPPGKSLSSLSMRKLRTEWLSINNLPATYSSQVAELEFTSCFSASNHTPFTVSLSQQAWMQNPCPQGVCSTMSLIQCQTIFWPNMLTALLHMCVCVYSLTLVNRTSIFIVPCTLFHYIFSVKFWNRAIFRGDIYSLSLSIY